MNTFTGGAAFAKFSSEVMKFIVPLFIFIFIGQFLYLWAFKYYMSIESHIMRKIMKNLFPHGKYSETGKGATLKSLYKSNLFTGLPTHAGAIPFSNFGIIEFDSDGTKLNIADIGVSTGKFQNMLNNVPGAGYASGIYKGVVRPIFSKRAENAVFEFRGMFAWAELKKGRKRTVIILPDKLEDKIGYLTHNIQALRNINGCKLMKMEDPEFESYFAVYSDDEVMARYILSPAMMMRITELKKKFGRDTMISFDGNKFHMAVSTPKGFLKVRSSIAEGKSVVQEIYDDVTLALEIFKEIKIQ